MTLGPIFEPNVGFKYANWAGAGYSADVLSPSFVPLTAAQESIPGYDSFDAVARIHDIAYDSAQQTLLSNLNNVNLTGSQDMIDYLSTLETADATFVASQAGASATTSWGSTVQTLGTLGLGLKAAVEAADIQRLETDPSYAAGWNALAQQYQSGGWSTAMADYVSNFLAQTSDEADGPSVDQVDAYDAELDGVPFISESSDLFALVADAIVTTPTLLPEFVDNGLSICENFDPNSLASKIQSAMAIYGPGLANAEAIVTQLATSLSGL